MVDLRDPPAEESVRRVSPEHSDAVLHDLRPYNYGSLVTEISVEPPLEIFLRDELQALSGLALANAEVDFIGFRYAYYFPSRRDDFVLRVTITGGGIDGTYEGIVGGDEQMNPGELFGPGYWERLPQTAPLPGAEPDSRSEASVQRLSDSRAYLHRAMIRLATRRIADSLP